MNKDKLSNLILLALEKSVDGYVRLEDFSYNPSVYARGYDRPLKKATLAQALRRLRIKGYLDLGKFNNQIIIKLTKEGVKQISLKKSLSDESPWDGKWRIVTFDIPEENRKVRDVLRSRLKMWHFEKWQKSVWVSKKDVTKPLKEFISETGIGKWVMIIESSDIN